MNLAQPEITQNDKWGKWDKRVRDIGIYILGLVGALNELFRQTEPRVTALLFIASMLGLPFVFRADELRARRDVDDA